MKKPGDIVPDEISIPNCNVCKSRHRRQIESWYLIEKLSLRDLREKIGVELPSEHKPSVRSLQNHFKKHVNDRSVFNTRLWYEQKAEMENDGTSLSEIASDPLDTAVKNMLGLEKTIAESENIMSGAFLELRAQLNDKVPKFYPIKDKAGNIIEYKRIDRSEPNNALVTMIKNLADIRNTAVKIKFEVIGSSKHANEEDKSLQFMKMLDELVHNKNDDFLESKAVDDDDDVIEVEFESMPDFGEDD